MHRESHTPWLVSGNQVLPAASMNGLHVEQPVFSLMTAGSYPAGVHVALKFKWFHFLPMHASSAEGTHIKGSSLADTDSAAARRIKHILISS